MLDQCLKIVRNILKFEGPEQKVKGPGQKLHAIGLRAGTMSNTGVQYTLFAL